MIYLELNLLPGFCQNSLMRSILLKKFQGWYDGICSLFMYRKNFLLPI